MLTAPQIFRRALPLLAAAGACALSASSALAAPAVHVRRPTGPRTSALLKPPGAHWARPSTRRTASASAVHSITSCGYVASSPGTYNVTQNLTDSGSGNCIEIDANNVTLNLNSHTITGSGTDTCVYVTETTTNYDTYGDSVNGVAAGSKRPANLQNCGDGVELYYTSGPTVSGINIHRPAYYGIYEEYLAGGTISHIKVYAPTSPSAGFEGYYGSGYTVSHMLVDANLSSNDYGFYIEEEYGDNFTHDTVQDTYSSTGDSGTGFEDYYSNRNTYSYDNALRQYDGFYTETDGYGSINLNHDTASDSATNAPNGYGFQNWYDYNSYDYNPPTHSSFTYDKSNGYEYGFYDYMDESGEATRETYSNDTATNYSYAGFYFGYYVTDYTISNNTADANPTGTTTPRYVSGTYGFYFDDPASWDPPVTLTGNKSYDNEYGYYSNGYAVSGTNNVAKRDHHASYNVQYNS